MPATIAPARAALALALAVALTGCIASQGASQSLSVAETRSGDLVVYLVIEDGQLTRSSAWWSEQAPELDLQIHRLVPGWEVLVLKNDVALEREPVVGTPENAFAVWRSSEGGASASAGDHFEFLVINNTAEQTVASFSLSIQA